MEKELKKWFLPDLFNKIPLEMQNYDNLETFKFQYKEWLIEKYIVF